MSKEKKGSSTVNYRISLVDDDTHVSLWSTKFTKMNAIIALVTALVEGDIRYVANDKEELLHIQEGFVEVKDNQVKVCVEV